MNLETFSIFITTVEEMNFKRAADKLFITQQCLSGHIRRLESAYNVSLFQRRPTLKLTPAGESMYTYAKQLIASETAMRSHFADFSNDATAILTVGTIRQRLDAFFPSICDCFYSKHSNITLRIMEDKRTLMLDGLNHGTVDMIIGPDIPRTTGILDIPLVKEPVYCLVADNVMRQYFPDDWECRVEDYTDIGLDLADLRNLPLLLPYPNTPSRNTVDKLFHKNLFIPHTLLECRGQNLLFQLGLSGRGAAVVNPLTLYNHLQTLKLPGEIHFFRIRDIKEHTISLAYRSDGVQPQYIRDMIQIITDKYQEYGEFLKTLN